MVGSESAEPSLAVSATSMSGSEELFMGVLHPDQVAEFKEAFNMFDKDGEGTIGPDEFKGMMKTLGLQLTEKEVQQLLEEVDEDGSGEIEFEEMLSALVKNMRETTPEEQLEEAFKNFDRDGKGWISKMDLCRVLQDMGETVTEEEAEAILRNANSGSGGLGKPKITKKEFIRMLKEAQ